ncbi:MAG: methylated-DNA--[protein]-cysteine S-methyltransferase [Kofleriaceae bacterium]|nr:methylated-DNA--[protein]-cysteine S-methyltransferase [Kofleriaceae bacterium]
MTPTSLHRAGIGLTLQVTIAPCSLGYVLTATNERGICAILLGDTADAVRADLLQRLPRATLATLARNTAPPTSQIIKQVVALVDNPAQHQTLLLDVQGTAFQQRVWQALRKIPVGTTISYSELATSIGAPSAARAIATACAANPCAVAIPCHRVVRNSGELAGYRWGLERKRALLDREKSPATPTPRKKITRG